MRREGQRGDLLREEPAGIVVRAHPALLEDDLALGGDVARVEEEVVHAVGLEIDHEGEAVRRDVDVVRRDVLAGEGVVPAAVLLDQTRELARPVGRRALEHHVLEEVGEAGAAARLVARAHPVPHLEGGHRTAMVLEEEHAQSVVEGGGHHAVGGAGRKGGEQEEHRREEERRHTESIPPGPAGSASPAWCIIGLHMPPWWALAAIILAASPASAATCTDPLTMLYDRVSPAVVSIQAMKINKAKPQRRFETVVGSGVIIDRDGQVLTNAHVVDNAASLSVTLDSKEKAPARVLGLDPVLDLALLRLETSSPLTTARLGDSSTLKVGEEVVAIGNPIGLDQTMTRGIVSALNRVLPGISDQPLIQTDAPINPGNSGGPLFDRCGNVIGINTFISEDAQSIGFAVPINAAKAVLKELREQGRVVRPWLGIQGREVDNRVGSADSPSRRPGLPGRGGVRRQPGRPRRHPRRQPLGRHPGRRVPPGW